MKKVVAFLVSAVLASTMLIACGPPAAESGGPNNDANVAANVTLDNIMIGFVHITDPSDMGYTYNHDLGTQEMQRALGLRDDQIINKFNINEGGECSTAIRELIEAGCNVIFATSFGFEDYMIELAAEHPEVMFFHATGYKAADSGLPNMHNYFASIYEGRYLAGIAAGLKTETNQLGYVAAFPFAEVISGYTAFYLGAKSVNPDVTMDIMYTNSWHDPTVEAQVTQALIDRGADVISQHSDSTAPATTAEENGVWQVGYNNDMIPAAPEASLISTRIDWSVYLIFAVNAVIAGETIPVDWCEGLAEGVVLLTPLNADIAAPGTQEAIDAAAAGIKSGEIQVFAGPLTGVGVDYNDETVEIDIPEGEHFQESYPGSAPSWIYIVPGCNVIE